MFRWDRVGTMSGRLWPMRQQQIGKKIQRKEQTGPLVDLPSYPTPTKILIRSRKGEDEKITKVEKITSQSNEETIDQIEIRDQTDDKCHLDSEDQRSTRSVFVINTVREVDEVDRVYDRSVNHESKIQDQTDDKYHLDREDQRSTGSIV